MVYTVSDAIEKLGFGNFQRRVYLLCGLHTLACGMQMLLLSLIQTESKCELDYTQEQAAFINSTVGLGFLVGSLFWGIFADSFGRYPALLLSSVVSLSFGIGSAFANNYRNLLLMRGLSIFGIGGSIVSYSLAMEFLPKSSRGWACPTFGCFWPTGVCTLYASAIVIMPTYGWRALIVFGSLPTGIFLVAAAKLPESPAWLVSSNKNDEAEIVLQDVSKSNNIPLPGGKLIESKSETAQQGEKRANTGLLSLTKPRIFSLSLKLSIPWFVTAFVYYGSVVLQPETITLNNSGTRCSYAEHECNKNRIFKNCSTEKQCFWKDEKCSFELKNEEEMSPKKSETQVKECVGKLTTGDYITSLVSSVGELSGLFIAFVLIENIGRRGILVYSYGISFLAFILLSLCTSKRTEMWLFFTIRGMGSCYFNTIYQITGEIFPAEIRSTAIGLFSAVCRIGLILTPTVGQILSAANFELATAIYAFSCVAALVATILIPIETTKRSMFTNVNELDLLLAGNENSSDSHESFKNDTNANLVFRFLRIPAQFDRTILRPMDTLP